MFRSLVCCPFLIGILCFVPSLVAQDEALVEIYGQGLHRYFAGDYLEADRLLSMIVDSGSQDARAHYFRGLSKYMRGSTHEAKMDFENGALAEARGKRVVNVGIALQRIQGSMRMEIEKARQSARATVMVEQAHARRIREEAARANAAVQSTSPAPSATAPSPAGRVPAADPSDPFAGKGALQAGQSTPDAAKPAADAPAGDATTNPFADDPNQGAPMPEPADANPFATPSADATAPAAPADATPAPADAGDPFATPPGDAPAPAADAPTAADDPFKT